MSERKYSPRALGIGLLAGLFVGAAVIYLYAPYSGREAREKLKGKYENLKDKFSEIRMRDGKCLQKEAIGNYGF